MSPTMRNYTYYPVCYKFESAEEVPELLQYPTNAQAVLSLDLYHSNRHQVRMTFCEAQCLPSVIARMSEMRSGLIYQASPNGM